MWMFFVLGCLDGVSAYRKVGGLSETAPIDSGELDADTGMGESAPSTLEPLSPSASWISDHPGYGTGGAFADIDRDRLDESLCRRQQSERDRKGGS